MGTVQRVSAAFLSWVLESRTVSHQTDFARNNVLHIGAEGASGAAAVSVAALATADDLCVETYGDVYRGLARLLRVSTGQFRAVIVCLDGLGAAEFEFFALLSRLRPTVPVYVHGRDGSQARIERAIRLGATAPVTEEVIRKLSDTPAMPILPANAPCDPISQTDEEMPPAERDADEDRLEPRRCTVPAAPVCEFDEPIERRDEPTEAHEDAPSGRVRVPWLRHHDGPVRQGPRGKAPAAVEPVESAAQRSAATEPLLTEEELQALLGDDIASIAPNLRVSPVLDEDGDAGALP